MEKEIINSIRMGFKEELEKSEGLPKRLKLSNEVAREILDKHEFILNTAGIHKVEEIFEDYKKRVVN